MNMDKKAIIITNDSKTTNEDADKILEYYEGGFKEIRKLEDDLKKFCEVDIYIISREYGILEGNDPVGKAMESLNQTYSYHEASEKILSKVESKDVIIILLKKNLLETVVLEHWEKIIENIKDGSILCMSVSSSLMEKIDIEKLEKEKNLKMIIYQRKGVARLDKETKNKLIQMLREKNDFQIK